MEYRNRKSILEKPTVYRLGPDAIEMQVEGQSPSSIPYAAVREVHLTFAPSRAQLNRYLADLKTHFGMFRLCSEFFKGPMEFGDQSQEYASWIRELHIRLGNANPGCRYTGGSNAAAWWLYLTGTIVLVAILIALFIAMLVSVPAVAIVKAVILALFFPTLILWFKRNRPTTYGPRDIPPKLLPATGTHRSDAGPPPLPRQGTAAES